MPKLIPEKKARKSKRAITAEDMGSVLKIGPSTKTGVPVPTEWEKGKDSSGVSMKSPRGRGNQEQSQDEGNATMTACGIFKIGMIIAVCTPFC